MIGTGGRMASSRRGDGYFLSGFVSGCWLPLFYSSGSCGSAPSSTVPVPTGQSSVGILAPTRQPWLLSSRNNTSSPCFLGMVEGSCYCSFLGCFIVPHLAFQFFHHHVAILVLNFLYVKDLKCVSLTGL